MTAATLAPVPRSLAADRMRPWVGPITLLATLAGIVAARWWATRLGLDALVVGAAFGLALGALAGAAHVAGRGKAASRHRAVIARGTASAIALGAVAGLALVGFTIVGGLANGPLAPGLGRPAAAFVPWALITVVVATTEEALLRGMLFDRVRLAGGTLGAIAITTVAFALLHVPLYGLHVVPLDIAVGLLFAGLRLGTGTVAAPAAAHAVADLATWWL